MFGLSTSQGFKYGEVRVEKITMDYVEDCGYDNLSLSRVMAWVFSLKRTPLNMWVMWVYIVWVEIRCFKYEKIVK